MPSFVIDEKCQFRIDSIAMRFEQLSQGWTDLSLAFDGDQTHLLFWLQEKYTHKDNNNKYWPDHEQSCLPDGAIAPAQEKGIVL